MRVEDVDWILHWDAGTGTPAIRHLYLEPASMEEILAIRAARTDVIKLGQPSRYCVHRFGTTANQYRKLIVDPFPESNGALLIGYTKKPNNLYVTDSNLVLIDVPREFQAVVLDRARFLYYGAQGMGAPQGSPAGRDYPQRAVAKQQAVQRRLVMMGRVQQRYDQRASLEPSSTERILWETQFGRNV